MTHRAKSALQTRQHALSVLLSITARALFRAITTSRLLAPIHLLAPYHHHLHPTAILTLFVVESIDRSINQYFTVEYIYTSPCQEELLSSRHVNSRRILFLPEDRCVFRLVCRSCWSHCWSLVGQEVSEPLNDCNDDDKNEWMHAAVVHYSVEGLVVVVVCVRSFL